MNIRTIIIALGILCISISCKKDEETSISPSLDGYLLIEGLPEFVSSGYEVSLTAKGVSHPDGKEIGYYWKAEPTSPDADTTKEFKFKFTDTLQTVTIYCYAYAEGYSSSSAKAYATVVKSGPDGSIKIQGFPSENIIEDTDCFYQQIGSQTWTANNLSEGTGKGFRDSELMADIFGRYYGYEDAIAACETLGTDWELPTLEDWHTLQAHISSCIEADTDYAESAAAALMGKTWFNGDEMWDLFPAVGQINNASGFSAIPTGYANLKSNDFDGSFEYSVFWTATTVEDNDKEAYCAYIICSEPDLFVRNADKESFGASVRCIRK